MTLEEYLECDAETIRNKTDADFEKDFERYLTVTRPEKAQRPSKLPPQFDNKFKQDLAKAKNIGLDLDFLLNPLKRKKK